MQNTKKLVLVVGAGASKEASLPIGNELKKQIANVLRFPFEYGVEKKSGDDLILDTLRKLSSQVKSPCGDFHSLVRASRRISDAMPQAISIDNFIDQHRSDIQIAICGKIAIARCILDSEAHSLMRVDRSNIYNKLNVSFLENTWFNSFFQLLTENCEQEELPARFSEVAIICFNYDRCIEHYLHSSLQNYYGMTIEKATLTLSHLEIHHPYGTVGALPWQSAQNSIDFGSTPNTSQLNELASGLRTFTEGTDPTNSDICAIRAAVSEADRIAFLGFAFHRLNLDLLFGGDVNNRPSHVCPIFSTALGISSSDGEIIKHDLSQRSGINPIGIRIRNDLTSSQLFSEYWRSLSLN